MINIEIQGNLGNQLFQYAFAREMQYLTGQSIVLNIHNFNKLRDDLIFSLDDFILNNDVRIERDEALPFYADSYSQFSRLIKKVCPLLYVNLTKKKGIMMWQGKDYIGLPSTDLSDYYLAGWFQSSKYFKDVEKKLKEELTPKYPLRDTNSELFEIIKNTESVCISIRRGDYVSNDKFRKMYFVCDHEYFTKAIKRMKEQVPNATFIFFSDDINWVRNNIKIDSKCYYESGVDPVWEKIRLMSACKHFIISNSSFSWWTQYLGRKNGSVIIAPSRWGVNETGPTDIYQNDWFLIDV